MKTQKGILKCVCVIVLLCFMPKACRMEYTCDVIDSMPQPIYHQLIADYPDWSIDQIADYYMENRDSLVEEMHLEQQWLMEIEEYLYEQNN